MTVKTTSATILVSTFVAVTLWGGAALGQALTFFGEITIGKEFTTPECSDNGVNPSESICYFGTSDSAFLKFPRREEPTYLGTLPPKVTVVNGVVVGLTIFTNGAPGQDEAFAALTKKLGKPRAKQTYKVKTVGGATHDGIEATWKKGDVEITFISIVGNVTNGVVSVDKGGKMESMRAKPREM